jgi:hypothetical protein
MVFVKLKYCIPVFVWFVLFWFLCSMPTRTVCAMNLPVLPGKSYALCPLLQNWENKPWLVNPYIAKTESGLASFMDSHFVSNKIYCDLFAKATIDHQIQWLQNWLLVLDNNNQSLDAVLDQQIKDNTTLGLLFVNAAKLNKKLDANHIVWYALTPNTCTYFINGLLYKKPSLPLLEKSGVWLESFCPIKSKWTTAYTYTASWLSAPSINPPTEHKNAVSEPTWLHAENTPNAFLYSIGFQSQYSIDGLEHGWHPQANHNPYWGSLWLGGVLHVKTTTQPVLSVFAMVGGLPSLWSSPLAISWSYIGLQTGISVPVAPNLQWQTALYTEHIHWGVYTQLLYKPYIWEQPLWFGLGAVASQDTGAPNLSNISGSVQASLMFQTQ